MESNGRKKHVVQGNVAPIKKQGDGLGTGPVGERKTGVLANLLKAMNSREKKR